MTLHAVRAAAAATKTQKEKKERVGRQKDATVALWVISLLCFKLYGEQAAERADRKDNM